MPVTVTRQIDVRIVVHHAFGRDLVLVHLLRAAALLAP